MHTHKKHILLKELLPFSRKQHYQFLYSNGYPFHTSNLCLCVCIMQLSQMPLNAGPGDIIQSFELPSLHLLYTLDSVISKLRISLQERFAKAMVCTILNPFQNTLGKKRKWSLILFELYSNPVDGLSYMFIICSKNSSIRMIRSYDLEIHAWPNTFIKQWQSRRPNLAKSTKTQPIIEKTLSCLDFLSLLAVLEFKNGLLVSEIE